MGLFGSPTAIGIDIGHATLKVVGVSLGKKPRVTGFNQVDVDANLLSRGTVGDPAEAAAVLKAALKGASPKPIHGRDAYLSVSESAVFRKVLEIPTSIPEADLPNVIRTSIVEFLPDDIETLELDYQVLPVQKSEEVRQVMVVAVGKQLIEQYLAFCTMAGLNVLAIDPKPSALLRAVQSPQATEPVAIVDVGSDVSSITICGQGAVWVAGTVTLGGDSLKDPTTGQIEPDQREVKIKRLATSLADELDHVIKFYANRVQGPSAHVKEVRMTGGGSLAEGLDKALALESDMNVVIAEPSIAVPAGFDRRLFGALGSALYGTREEK